MPHGPQDALRCARSWPAPRRCGRALAGGLATAAPTYPVALVRNTLHAMLARSAVACSVGTCKRRDCRNLLPVRRRNGSRAIALRGATPTIASPWPTGAATARDAGAPPAADEFTRHFEINLHRRGWHVRSVARQRYFIDPLHHSLWPADSGFQALGQHCASAGCDVAVRRRMRLIEESLAAIAGVGSAALRRLRSRACALAVQRAHRVSRAIAGNAAGRSAGGRREFARADPTCRRGSGRRE